MRRVLCSTLESGGSARSHRIVSLSTPTTAISSGASISHSRAALSSCTARVSLQAMMPTGFSSPRSHSASSFSWSSPLASMREVSDVWGLGPSSVELPAVAGHESRENLLPPARVVGPLEPAVGEPLEAALGQVLVRQLHDGRVVGFQHRHAAARRAGRAGRPAGIDMLAAGTTRSADSQRGR